MEHSQQLEEVGAWAGFAVVEGLVDRLEALAEWFQTEGLQAGGIGPNERGRVWERHVLDSLMFARGWGAAPDEVVDAGTGIGLPGLPLALALPEVGWRLLDRSGRRIRLIRRAIRRFGIDNAEAVETDLETWFRDRTTGAVVMRGVLTPPELAGFLEVAVAPGGVLVTGAGLEPVAVPDSELVRFPGSAILAPGRWLRIMRRV